MISPRNSLVAIALAALTLPAAAQTIRRQKAPVTVGPVVHVTKAYGNLAHYESLAAGDPDRPGRMMTCSTVFPNNVLKSSIYQYCYASFDGGKTWETTLKLEEGSMNGDPAIAYGRGDTVYVVALWMKSGPEKPDTERNEDMYADSMRRTVVYRSIDGGRTFPTRSEFELIDREYINVDRTNGRYGGRIYLAGQGGVRVTHGTSGGSQSTIELWRSPDGGKSFFGPLVAGYPKDMHMFGVGTGGVLSDGTYVIMFNMTKPGRSQMLEFDPTLPSNAEMLLYTSKTGGESFEVFKVADIKMDRGRNEGSHIGQLAVDPGSAAFKDRIYMTWVEIVDGRGQIAIAHSADKGKTWSAPLIVNDDRSPIEQGSGPDHVLPAVGVNKDGVVFVAWYDRRDYKDNLGWKLRGAVSMDGGETFSENFVVGPDVATTFAGNSPLSLSAHGGHDTKSSTMNLGIGLASFATVGGHTTGLAVDADGTFHPIWHSSVSGTGQMYTASIKVNGVAQKEGSAELAAMTDVSKNVILQLTNPKIDRGSGKLTVTAQLKNTTNDTVDGPIKVRVLALDSDIGVPEVADSENGLNGIGAMWDFSSTLSGPLLPLKFGAPKTLTFRLTDMRPLQGTSRFSGRVSQLLTVKTRAYGKLRKAAKPKEEEKK
jgi:hypothetical protein